MVFSSVIGSLRYLRNEQGKIRIGLDMQNIVLLIAAVSLLQIELRAQTAPTPTPAPTPTKSNIPYVDNADERQVLDIYAPPNAKEKKDLPVVFWIHGGGWQAGDKNDVKLKPQWFMDHGFVFVSTNYRLWPSVDMG